jgi:hypothetical protein
MKTRHVIPVIVVSWALSMAAAIYPLFCGGFQKIPQQAMCIFDLTQVSEIDYSSANYICHHRLHHTATNVQNLIYLTLTMLKLP